MNILVHLLALLYVLYILVLLWAKAEIAYCDACLAELTLTDWEIAFYQMQQTAKELVKDFHLVVMPMYYALSILKNDLVRAFATAGINE